jgi:hypothetical protein
MNKNLSQHIIKNNNVDAVIFFLSADFFSNYWEILTPEKFNAVEIEMINKSARECICDFFPAKSNYWMFSDFSEKRCAETWNGFDKKIDALPNNLIHKLEILIWQLAVPEYESKNVDFLISLIFRLINDNSTRLSLSYAKEDAELLGVAYEDYSSLSLNCYEIGLKWQSNDDHSKWDLWMKNILYDTDSFISNVFSDAYQKSNTLPKIIKNLKMLFESKSQYINFISRLELAFKDDVPKKSNLNFPFIFNLV